LVLGGLPHKTKGKNILIDTKRCDELFPAVLGFETSQLLFYQEKNSAACDGDLPPTEGSSDPQDGARARFCDSGYGKDWADNAAVDDTIAGLDDTFRECPSTISLVTGEITNHTASYEILDFQFEILADFNPQSYNLNSCPDEGRVNVQFSTQDGVDVNLIAGLDSSVPSGISSKGGDPKLTPFNADTGLNEPGPGADTFSVPLERANFSDTDFDGIFDTVKLSYKTCRVDNFGLSQILEDNPDIVVTEGGKYHIDVTLQGTTEGGTVFGAFDYDHKVVDWPPEPEM